MIESADELDDFVIGEAAFDADGTLADRGDHAIEIEDAGDAMAEAEAFQSSGGEKYGVVAAFVEFGKTGVDIAAQELDFDVGSPGEDLGGTTERRGAESGSLREGLKRGDLGREEGVARVFSFKDGGEAESFGELRGDVFHRVDRQVCTVLEEGVFDFFDEESFAADFRKGDIKNFVALRLEDD
jgi:hypothetical protein